MQMLFVSYLVLSSEQMIFTISAVAPALTGLQLITSAFMRTPLQRMIHSLIKALRKMSNNKQTAMPLLLIQQMIPLLSIIFYP
jgi:hypothetical protein